MIVMDMTIAARTDAHPDTDTGRDRDTGTGTGKTKAIRHDGWTNAKQRAFLEALAACGSVTQAARATNMSRQSAHSFRARRDGLGFKLGWDAAILNARAQLVDELYDRALYGQEETISRDPATNEVTRRRSDNRLGMSMLTRMDRMMSLDCNDEDAMVARIVAQDFHAYLDMLETRTDARSIRTFLATRQDMSLLGLIEHIATTQEEESAPNQWCKLHNPVDAVDERATRLAPPEKPSKRRARKQKGKEKAAKSTQCEPTSHAAEPVWVTTTDTAMYTPHDTDPAAFWGEATPALPIEAALPSAPIHGPIPGPIPAPIPAPIPVPVPMDAPMTDAESIAKLGYRTITLPPPFRFDPSDPVHWRRFGR
jgi:hypothetical protein